MTGRPPTVEGHYAIAGLTERILVALAAAGLDPDRLAAQDLSLVDQLHTRGLAATREQAAALALDADARVLDIGCGIGGPARWLAENYGCRVSGIDLTAEYIDAARALTERCGLAAHISFDHGNALDMPYGDGAFNVVWAQNVSMNIADKSGLLAEVVRVLAPGGQLSLSEVAAGPAGAPHYPLPWARHAAISFLATPAEMRRLIGDAGLELIEFSDHTEADIAFRKSAAGQARLAAANGLDARLAFGDDYPARSANSARSLEEGRLANIRVLARKPA